MWRWAKCDCEFSGISHGEIYMGNFAKVVVMGVDSVVDTTHKPERGRIVAIGGRDPFSLTGRGITLGSIRVGSRGDFGTGKPA